MMRRILISAVAVGLVAVTLSWGVSPVPYIETPNTQKAVGDKGISSPTDSIMVENYSGENPYAIYLPKGYTTTGAKWPVLVCTGGAGELDGNEGGALDPGEVIQSVFTPMDIVYENDVSEAGDFDLQNNARMIGLHAFVLPRFVIILLTTKQEPCSGANSWGSTDKGYGAAYGEYKQTLNNLATRYNIDPNRIYATGLCVGGMQMLNLCAMVPNIPCALAMFDSPVGGAGGGAGACWAIDSNSLGSLKGKVSVALHYEIGDNEEPQTSYPGMDNSSCAITYNALHSRGVTVDSTWVPGGYHASWSWCMGPNDGTTNGNNPADYIKWGYGDTNLYKWFLSQSKNGSSVINPEHKAPTAAIDRYSSGTTLLYSAKGELLGKIEKGVSVGNAAKAAGVYLAVQVDQNGRRYGSYMVRK